MSQTAGTFDQRRESLEDLLLLVLGAVPETPMSMLHLEKEIYILYNFHPAIPKFIEYRAHLRGPYSSDIESAIFSPYIRTEDWDYIPAKKGDKYSSGSVRLTETGKKHYQELYQVMMANKKMHSLLSGIEIVRGLYDRLTPKEFIYLIYKTYPEMTVNSEIKKEIFADSELISKNLQKIGYIAEPEISYVKEPQHP